MTYRPSPLEIILCHPSYFGLTTASNAQRAVCRIADGFPLGKLWDDPAVRGMLGNAKPPEIAPRKLMVIAPIRGGKSLLSAAFGIRCALFADCSSWRPGEAIPRVPIVSTDLASAKLTFEHLSGHSTRSPILSRKIRAAGAIKAELSRQYGGSSRTVLGADSLTLIRDDGVPVEIQVRAQSRAGSTLAGKWLAGMIFDEVTLMVGDVDAVVTLDSSLLAVEGRMLPGGQQIMIGSTVAPPFGTAYEILNKTFGNPTEEQVTIWALGKEFLPSRFTDEYLGTVSTDVRQTMTERVFLDPSSGYFTRPEIESRIVEIEPIRRSKHHYTAAMDPAFRRNYWTLVVVEGGELTDGGQKARVVSVREWAPEGGAPLSASLVLGQIAEHLRSFGIEAVDTDQYAVDPLTDAAKQYGLHVSCVHLAGAKLQNAFLLLGSMVRDRLLEIPNHAHLISDLIAIRKLAPRGSVDGIRFVLPQTPDGRHCDTIPALIRALANIPCPPDELAVMSEDEQLWKEFEGLQRDGGVEEICHRVIGSID